MKACGRVFVIACCGARLASAEADPWSHTEASDRYSLLDQRLVNRQLLEQLEGQPYRLGAGRGRWGLAGDLSIGTQQTAGEQTRYHGWYVADLFAAARLVEGLEANFNLLALNPSASDGYRTSSQITAALTLEATCDIVRLGSDPVRAKLLGTDLGTVTVGQGLLLERTPIEGIAAQASWRSVAASMMFGGRALWNDDDLLTISLSVLDGRIELILAEWKKHRLPAPSVVSNTWPDTLPSDDPAWYGSVALDLPLPGGFRLASEYALRPRHGALRQALLLRGDYLSHPARWLDVHAGYQFRYYDDRFGPRDRLWPPLSVFNTRYQEEMYVTNPFEYFALSEAFAQWSHTTMYEVRVRPWDRWELFGNAELWLRFAAARHEPRWVAFTPDGFRAPGSRASPFYDVGLRFYPWVHLPHRAATYLTNKQAISGEQATDAVPRRFQTGTYLVIELEAYL